jgi:hypothetical protein
VAPDLRVAIIPYEKFPLDWKTLDAAAQLSIGRLLEKLQNNPYDPDLQAACEIADEDRFAFRIAEGYVVFWRITYKSAVLSLSSWDNLTVEITGIQAPPPHRSPNATA